MNESKFVFLSSVKHKILTEIIPAMLEKNLIFTDKYFSVGIKDFKDEIISQNVTEFGIYNFRSNERIGILDFSDSSFSRASAKNKIIWRITIDDLTFEKKALKVAHLIQGKSKKIHVRLITNVKK